MLGEVASHLGRTRLRFIGSANGSAFRLLFSIWAVEQMNKVNIHHHLYTFLTSTGCTLPLE